MGAEVTSARLWKVAAEHDIARMLFVTCSTVSAPISFARLESLKAAFGPHVVATEIPIGSEHEISGVVDLVDMRALQLRAAGARQRCRDRDPRRGARGRRRSTARS